MLLTASRSLAFEIWAGKGPPGQGLGWSVAAKLGDKQISPEPDADLRQALCECANVIASFPLWGGSSHPGAPGEEEESRQPGSPIPPRTVPRTPSVARGPF